jgi:hypothetical protein
MRGEHRHRLLDLTRRLARVQELGGEYGRVCLSEQAAAALAQMGYQVGIS